jgi:hypothetical protein
MFMKPGLLLDHSRPTLAGHFVSTSLVTSSNFRGCRILVVTSRFSVSPSIAGLVLAYLCAGCAMMGWMVRQFAEVENNMNATERVHHYANSNRDGSGAWICRIGNREIRGLRKVKLFMKDVVLQSRLSRRVTCRAKRV